MMLNKIKTFLSRSKKPALSVVMLLFILTPVMAEEEEEAPPAWVTSLAFGMNLARGNSDLFAANAGLDAIKETEKYDVALGAYANYGETDSDASSQNAKGFAVYRKKWNRYYLYTDNSLFHDKIAAIKYRFILGGGGGYHLLMTERHKLGLETGLAYIWEEEYEVLSAEDGGSDNGDLTDNYLSIRFAQRYDYTLSESSMLWQSLEFLPRADDFGNYLFNAEAGVEAALNTRLNLRFFVQDRYNSEPPPGLKKNDVAVITALVFKF